MISLIIINLFFELISSNSFFYFSFKTNKTDYSKNHLSIINHIQKNFIYTSITTGINKRSIPVFLRISKSYSLSLPNSNIDTNLKYNKYDINSKSLKILDKNEQNFYSENINKGFKGEEIFYLKNIKNDKKEKIKSKFIISTEQKIIGGGQLGFFYKTLSSTDDLTEFNLMFNLIQNQQIKNNIFSVEYTSENEGKFYIGGFPDEFTKKYLNKDYLYVKSKESLNWGFSIENIFSGENEVDKFIDSIIDYENGFIEANFEYFSVINRTFFNKYSKDCSAEFYNKKYYLICKNININKFPDLIFNLDSIKFNLTLNGKDLFKKINNKYYFLVSFNANDEKPFKWILGKPLLKKYLFVFNREYNQIGLYSKKYNTNYINYPIIILVILILVIIVLVIFIYLKKKHIIIKFKKANELLENNYVDSFLNTNNNNNNNKESDYKIIN